MSNQGFKPLFGSIWNYQVESPGNAVIQSGANGVCSTLNSPGAASGSFVHTGVGTWSFYLPGQFPWTIFAEANILGQTPGVGYSATITGTGTGYASGSSVPITSASFLITSGSSGNAVDPTSAQTIQWELIFSNYVTQGQ